MRPFSLSVPASSGNIGPGFDSMGLALTIYLTMEVTEAKEWEFISPSLASNNNYEEHFIYQIAKQTAERHHKQLPACKVTETSTIPLARGLGSSASAILAGIEIANQACELSLSPEEKLRYGTEIEGHPDNIAPALYSGIVISMVNDKEIDWIQLPELNIDLVVYIPEVELKTKAARNVLPDNYTRSQAASASAVSNMVVASLLSGDFKLAGKMMEQDLFHEPYRAELIPNYNKIRLEAKKHGAHGTVISGAGPTMISTTPKNKGKALAGDMQKLLPDYRVEALEIDRQGLKVEYLGGSN